MVLDLDGFWSSDQIFSPFPSSFIPASPFLFSAMAAVSEQPLWEFSDDDDTFTAALASADAASPGDHLFLTAATGHPDSVTRSPPSKEDGRRQPLPVLRLTSLDYPECVIKERLAQALMYFKEVTVLQVLAQVWAPVKNGSHYMLTTSGQPFFLDTYTTGLRNYRMVSLMYKFSVDVEETDGILGLPGRVFSQKLPEWTPNVQYYSDKEFPLLLHALNYNIRGTIALPVFEPLGNSCVGVLELITHSQAIHASEVDKMCKALEAVNLRSSGILNHLNNPQIRNNSRQNALADILEILTVVCKTYNLPMGQTWVPCRHRSVLSYGGDFTENCSSFDGSCMGQVWMSTTDVAVYVVEAHMWGFRDACAEHHLQKGQGVAGRAFASKSSCFCENITQFCKAEYPLVHYARMFGLVGSFAICLRSTYTGEDEYILEFLLPFDVVDSMDQQTLIGSLLTTMKQHFRSLRIASGEEVCEEGTSFEIIKASINEKHDSDIESIRLSESKLSPGRGPEVLPNGGGMVEVNSLDQPQMMEFDALTGGEDIEDTFRNGVNLIVSEQRENRITRLDEASRVNILQRENRVTDYVLSYEVIKEHFGRKLEDAAQILNVSRSKLKRICRDVGIQRWPSPRRKKVKKSHSNVTHRNKLVQSGDEPIPESCNRETSTSLLPPSQAIADVALVQDQSHVVINAIYGEDIVKFELSSSSGMAELVEKVAQRLKFRVGTLLRLKYEDDDGDWVLVTCDEDLQFCIHSSGSLGKKTAIRFVVHPVTPVDGSHACGTVVSTTWEEKRNGI